MGCEAEFVGRRDTTMLYRGILMPFSSDGEAIDFVYGVINWKALADPTEVERFAAAARAALEMRPAVESRGKPGPARGARAGHGTSAAVTLARRIGRVRDAACRAGSTETGARAALHHALGLAYDLVVEVETRPADFVPLVTDGDQRSLAQAIVALAFEDRVDVERAAELADALAHARRLSVRPGGFADYADSLRGGIRMMIAAERAAA